MTRLPRLVLAALTANAALLAGALAVPRATYACSCAPTHVADFIGDPEHIIVSGTVVDVRPNQANGGQLATFLVDRVFQGVLPGPELRVIGGGGGDCTVTLDEGMLFIGVASVSEGVLRPFLCWPFGDLRDQSGRAILADVRRFIPDAPPREEPITFERVATLALPAAGAIALGLAALAGVLALSSRRQRR